MKTKHIHLGEIYCATISGKKTEVKIIEESPLGGWIGINLLTKRNVRIKSGRKLRPRTLGQYCRGRSGPEINQIMERRFASALDKILSVTEEKK